ncbi:MAG: hypothetical protein SVM79_09235 [Chloroflexota bacterium]|nr:hypothetical protein [Chloroflexota bacterium]
MMKVWGMLSTDAEKEGFDLVLDEDWYVVLINKGNTVSRFDPRDYTATELVSEVDRILQSMREAPSKKPKKKRPTSKK